LHLFVLAVTAVTAISVFALHGRGGPAEAGRDGLVLAAVTLPGIPVGYSEDPANLALLPGSGNRNLVSADPGQANDDPEAENPQAEATPSTPAEPGDPSPDPSATPSPDDPQRPRQTPTERPRKTPTPRPAPRPQNVIAHAYRVRPGDTLFAIAAEYGVSVDSILWNNIHVSDANELYVGQQLQIPAEDGVIYSIVLGDTLTEIADTYDARVNDIIGFKPNKIRDPNDVALNTMILIPGGQPPPPQPIPVPTEVPAPEETPAPEEVPTEAPTENPTQVPPSNVIPVGQAHTIDNLRLRKGSGTQHETVTIMPLNSAVEVIAAPKNGWYPIRFAGLTGWASGEYLAAGAPDPNVVVPTPGPTSAGGWQWPLIGPINSYFGGSHPLGIDIGTNGVIGKPIVAAKGGTVIFAGGNACCSYGYYVIVDHGGGFTSRYAHLSSISVSLGQNVAGGGLLGLSGSTGYSTGPHLHFEIRINGTPVNPLGYLP
jgi:murein DD-endopeptidase MepM/ murein hydrolase activator NlpD